MVYHYSLHALWQIVNFTTQGDVLFLLSFLITALKLEGDIKRDGWLLWASSLSLIICFRQAPAKLYGTTPSKGFSSALIAGTGYGLQKQLRESKALLQGLYRYPAFKSVMERCSTSNCYLRLLSPLYLMWACAKLWLNPTGSDNAKSVYDVA